MAEVQGTPHSAPGIKGFMTHDTMGMPNWVWLLVIAGGIGLALAVKYYGSKSSSSSTSTGTDQTSGLGLAVDPTTGLPYAVEGLVPAGGTVGAGTDTTGTPPPSTWPTVLSGMKIWEGTTTHEFFYGPKGPQKGRKDQFALSSVFPSGTTFLATSGGKGGSTFFYILPGTTTPIQAPVTLVDPTPGKGGPPTSMAEIAPVWPGSDVSQFRMQS